MQVLLRLYRSRFARSLLYWMIYASLALRVLLSFVECPGIEGFHKAMITDMIDGKAYRPFVYRVLLPATIRLTLAAIPDSVEHFSNPRIQETQIAQKFIRYYGWNPNHMVEYSITLFYLFLTLLAFSKAFHYLIDGLFEAPPLFKAILSIVALGLMPVFFNRYYCYIYDFTTLVLFTLGLGLMAHARWRLFVLAFVLACLNKETTILLTLIFAIHFSRKDRMEPALFKRLLVFQLAAFAVMKVTLALFFMGNEGSFVKFHMYDHNIFLMIHHPHLFYVWIRSAIIFAIVAPYRWSEKPGLLKNTLWIFPVLVILDFFFGFLDELRTYYEIYPMILLIMAHSVGAYFGVIDTKSDEMGALTDPTQPS